MNTLKLLSFSSTGLCCLFLFASCANNSTSSNPTGSGPFDKNGNYIEGWADKNYASTKEDVLPPVVQNDTSVNDFTPSTYTPIQKSSATKPITTIKKPSYSAQASKKTSSPSKSSTSKSTSLKSSSKSKKSIASAPKSKTTRHIVKRGDSLSKLASKYGTTVTAIKKANKLKSDLILDGKSLVIPK